MVTTLVLDLAESDVMNDSPDHDSWLRHAVATLAYRAAKALRGADEQFSQYLAAPGTRTPAQLLAHLGDLLDWAASHVRGQEVWKPVAPTSWDGDLERFFRALSTLDDLLKQGVPDALAFRLLQGPIADALTHVGQLALLRRLAGQPIRGENYARAAISTGVVGREQPAPAFEFD